MVPTLKLVAVVLLMMMATSGQETTEDPTTEGTTEITENFEEAETTTELASTTEELETTTMLEEAEEEEEEKKGNGTDVREPKRYYRPAYTREPPLRYRGTVKYRPVPGAQWNRIQPGWVRPPPRPWVKPYLKPGMSKTDFSDYQVIDIRKQPIYPGEKIPTHRYKVEESSEGDLQAEGSDPLPSLASIITPVMSVASHVNDTVLAVERILKAHPELPRLNRNEILSYLNNITEANKKGDLNGEVLESENQGGEMGAVTAVKEGGSRSREDDDRSLMVVLPYKASEEDNMEELFTRRPIVQIVDEHKVTTYAPKFNMEEFMKNQNSQAQSEQAYIPINKEDTRYNPPLKVIGFRYNKPTTTDIPATTKTYTNYKDIELVTKKMQVEIVNATSYLDNHKSEEDSSNKVRFSEPHNMDSFSLEDAVMDNEVVETGTESPVFITNPLPDITERPVFSSQYSKTTARFEPTTPRPRKTTTTTQGHPDIAPVMDLLPDNMKHVLENMGMVPSAADSQEASFPDTFERQPPPPAKPTIDPSSFLFFKPLPVSKQHKTVADDMRDFLASFGLMQTGRESKQVKQELPAPRKYLDDVPQINSDFLTEDMKSVLMNLGLFRTNKNSRIHIFNPSNHSLRQTEEEAKKLNELLGTIKKLTSLNESEVISTDLQAEVLQKIQDLDNLTNIGDSNSTSIKEEIKEIMVENKDKFNFTIPFAVEEDQDDEKNTTLEEGPDPVQFSEGLEWLKNEVKRQENSTKNEEEEEDTANTSETEAPNAPGLEESFGGGETAPADADVESSLPPKRPNGLYLLLDWNSFLEVGTEDDARRVNIRFQPKIGDGRNFLPVTVP